MQICSFFAIITGKMLIIKHYQLYQHLPVKLNNSCLYLSLSCYICICPIKFAHFFIFAFFLLNSSWSCYICICPIFAHFFIFAFFLLNSCWSFYICIVELNLHLSYQICNFFIFAFFLLNSSWSCYICMVELNLHCRVIFAFYQLNRTVI